MKRLLIIPLLFICLLLKSQSYYHFSATGNDDTGTGTQVNPWQTITKANTINLSGGDSLVFKRGDTFSGTLTITDSGTSGNPIIIGAYGTGADPVITGFVNVTTWADQGSNIWRATASTSLTTLEVLTIDGTQYAMGRYPNYGTWLSYESFTESSSRLTTITDNTLSDSPDWTGATAVIRATRWMVERDLITDHNTGGVLSVSGGTIWGGATGYGYFIENDVRTLDQFGEWYFNGTTKNIDIYSTDDPDGYTIKTSALTSVVTVSTNSYVTFDNLVIEGSNGRLITFADGSSGNVGIVIQNCTLRFAGSDIIYSNSVSGSYTINNNTIYSANACGLRLRGTTNTHTITNNNIYNIGVLEGHGNNDDTWGDGVLTYGTNSVIDYNIINNVGHNSISLKSGSGQRARYNYITYFGMTRYDAGGIYSWNGADDLTSRSIISNIVLYSETETKGMPAGTSLSLFGIYLDEYSRNAEVKHNTVAHVSTYGIYCLNTADNDIKYNTAFNNGYQFGMGHAYSYGLDVTGFEVKGNIFLCKDASQYSFLYRDDDGHFLTSSHVYDSNYYARPPDDDYVIRTYDSPTYTSYTLAQWKTYSSQDAHSLGSPISIVDTSKIDFYYNASQTDDSVFNLPYASVDVTGTKYNTTDDLTLDAYESAVLMEDPDPDSDPPDNPTVTHTLGLYTIRNATILSSVTGANVGTVSSKGICYNTTGNPTTSDTKTTEAAGVGTFTSNIGQLVANTTYYVRTYAVNDLGTTYSDIIEFTTPVYAIGTSGGKITKTRSGKIAIIR